MWSKLMSFLFGWLKKKEKPKPEPTPDFVNVAVGYRIRMKTYEPPYKERRFSAKIDTRFYTDMGMNHGNTRLEVDGVLLDFYGYDEENGKKDMSFCDKRRYHKDLPKPVDLKIFKDGNLHTWVKIPAWKYGEVYVQSVVDNAVVVDRPEEPEPDSDNDTNNSGNITKNIPPFVWGMDERKWSKEQARGYNFNYCRYLKPDEKWKGEMMCPDKLEATNMMYRLRSHIEHDPELEGGYKGRVYCGYSKKGMLTLKVHDDVPGKLSWFVQP